MKFNFKRLMKKLNVFAKVGVWYRKRTGAYPKSYREVLDPNFKYKKEVLEALARFKETKPWQGDIVTRLQKIVVLNNELSEIYQIIPPRIALAKVPGLYLPQLHLIALDETNPSVLTFLHEFGHVLGKKEWQTCQWSINLFKRTFPVSFKKLQSQGHVLYKKPDATQNIFTFK